MKLKLFYKVKLKLKIKMPINLSNSPIFASFFTGYIKPLPNQKSFEYERLRKPICLN